MEILVILMLAMIFLAITMFIVSFVMVKKRHTDRIYSKNSDDLTLLDEMDDDDDNKLDINRSFNEVLKEDESLIVDENNLVSSVSYEKEQPEVILDIKDDVNKSVDIQPEIIEIENDQYDSDNKMISQPELIDVIVPSAIGVENNEVNDNISKKVSEGINKEVVNVLINKKNYIFLANNNVVKKNDHIKLLLNKKVYYGLVTKGNYLRDISSMKLKPHKLVIVKDKGNNNKEDNQTLDNEEVDFVPKKKNSNI